MSTQATTSDGAFHLEGLERGELLVQFCVRCSRYQFPPMPGCRRCGAADGLEVRQSAGRGRVYSWTVAHYAFEPDFDADVPFTVVEVALDEGVRIFGRLASGLVPSDGLDVVASIVDLHGQKALSFGPTGTEADQA